jgi:hypothetical protein
MHLRQPWSRFSIPVLFGVFIIAISLAGGSCKKEQLLQSGGELRFSTDTLTFDTVFTSLGSATVGLKIYNPQSEKVNISSIRLAGGASSPFRLNVDGKSGDGANIELAAGDSIYVFATVTVDPTDANTPFIVEDKLVASLNGRDFSIPVLAYGQNAYYIRGKISVPTQTLKTDKPYVMMGWVQVDSGNTLTIPAGCRIYMHANARLFVAGTLEAIGTKEDSIIFQGNRLDRSYFGYEGYPGEWGGIYFTQYSRASVMKYVIIRNCGNGAQGAPPAAVEVAPDLLIDSDPQLTLEKVTIENSIGYGLLAFNGSIKAENCLIHSCGASALALMQGGDYELNNCTIATYGNNKISHNDNPAAVILNYYKVTQTTYLAGGLSCTLRNCVIAGSLEHEFFVDSVEDEPASVTMYNCLVKADESKLPSWLQRTNVRFTRPGGVLDPQFTDVPKMNYRPKAGSPLIDAGIPVSGLTTDLDDNPRDGQPDIGCYEGQP